MSKMTKDELLVATINDLVEVLLHEKGVEPPKFFPLTQEQVVKFAVAGVEHRLHNMEYNKKTRQKGKLLDQLVESGVLSQETVDSMLKK